jgi:hypothetical protein
MTRCQHRWEAVVFYSDTVIERRESFPASDPPSWTMGVARRAAIDPAAGVAAARVTVRTTTVVAPVNRDVIDVSVPPDRRGLLRRAFVGSMGAVGIALLAPVVILLAGLPVVLVVRAVVEVIGRVATGIVR